MDETVKNIHVRKICLKCTGNHLSIWSIETLAAEIL